MEKYDRLSPFWEPDPQPTFPLSRSSEFGRRACEAFEAAGQEAVAAGRTGYELETSVRWAKEVAAIRIYLTCDVLGEDQRTLARRIRTNPETLSRICTRQVAAPYSVELAVYRELLHFAILEWVNAWAISEAWQEFEHAYLANPICFGGYTIGADPDHGFPDEKDVTGFPITDRFGRALFALGAVCGPDGWKDFWKEVGCHLYPIAPYEGSAQFFSQRLKEQRKREGGRSGADA